MGPQHQKSWLKNWQFFCLLGHFLTEFAIDRSFLTTDFYWEMQVIVKTYVRSMPQLPILERINLVFTSPQTKREQACPKKKSTKFWLAALLEIDSVDKFWCAGCNTPVTILSHEHSVTSLCNGMGYCQNVTYSTKSRDSPTMYMWDRKTSTALN